MQVVLPDGQRQEWRLASAKDLDKKLGGGALLNKSTEPPRLKTYIEDIEENQLYHLLLPPERSSNSRTNVTLWLPLDDGHRYVKRILPYVTQEVLAHMLATYSADGVRTADQPENYAITGISLLEDGGEYWGVPTKISRLRGEVGAHNLPPKLLVVVAITMSISI